MTRGWSLTSREINTEIMKIRIIRSEKEYGQYLDWADQMFDKRVAPDTIEGEQLQVVLLLIRDYEDKHYPVPKPDPIDAIRSKMQDLGLRNKDLVGQV